MRHSKPRYDLDLVKSAASNRWPEIIASLGNVSGELLDGNHHACPKSCHPDAGGHDRFRALNDFQQTGALFCNQCFNSKNGDGFAALQWLNGEDFATTLERVAKYVGVKAEPGRKKSSPDDNLEFLPWNKTAAGLWCLKKKPMQVAALEQLGARYARYLKHYTVIAIPVWGPQLNEEPPCGWIIYRSDGGDLPKYAKKGQEPEWKKVLLTKGSQQGVICCVEQWKSIGTDAAPHTWWKLEGSTDLLAAMSQDWPDNGHAFFTTANGAMEKPLDWIAKSLADCRVFVCHDADNPGQDGATWVQQGSKRRAGWCPTLAKQCADVRNVKLPFAVEPTHGPDIRDFFAGGGSVGTLIKTASQADKWASDESLDDSSTIVLNPESPVSVRLDALTKNFSATKSLYTQDGSLVAFHGSQALVVSNVDSLIGWSSQYFDFRAREEDSEFRLLDKNFAKCWMHNPTELAKLPEINCITYIPCFGLDWSITQPGWSQGGIYYIGDPIPPIAGTSHIDDLLVDFCFSSDADRTNYIAMLLTCILMPHFSTAKKAALLLNGNQPGLGKSELAQVVSVIKQGFACETISYIKDDIEFEKNIGSLVDDRSCTTVVIDNCKTRTGQLIESACLERSITDSRISMRRLGHSERIRMQNNHMFVITANGSQLGPDIRTRCLLVDLSYQGDPRTRKFKLRSPHQFAFENRSAIVGELLHMVQSWRDAGAPMRESNSRFGVWASLVGSVLAHAGLRGFLSNDEQLAELDPSEDYLSELMRIMADMVDYQWTAAELLTLCRRQKLFTEEIGNGSEKSQQTRIGKLLPRFRDRSLPIEIDEVHTQFAFRVGPGKDGRTNLYWIERTTDDRQIPVQTILHCAAG